MSDGMSDANAMGGLSTRLREASCKMRDAIKAAEDGHRGMSLDVQEDVNEILLPSGWKIVRATPHTSFR